MRTCKESFNATGASAVDRSVIVSSFGFFSSPPTDWQPTLRTLDEHSPVQEVHLCPAPVAPVAPLRSDLQDRIYDSTCHGDILPASPAWSSESSESTGNRWQSPVRLQAQKVSKQWKGSLCLRNGKLRSSLCQVRGTGINLAGSHGISFLQMNRLGSPFGKPQCMLLSGVSVKTKGAPPVIIHGSGRLVFGSLTTFEFTEKRGTSRVMAMA